MAADIPHFGTGLYPSMSEKEVLMHFKAARAAGQESACGMKMQHDQLASAQVHADSLNKREEKAGSDKRFEAYPCPFCSPSTSVIVDRFYFHVGRAMTREEREQYR